MPRFSKVIGKDTHKIQNAISHAVRDIDHSITTSKSDITTLQSTTATHTSALDNLNNVVDDHYRSQNQINYHVISSCDGYATKASPQFTGVLYVNDTADTGVTNGLVLNQGANDDIILSCKSSDVAHGITDICETDTYFHIRKASNANGGVALRGQSEANSAFFVIGNVVSVDTTSTSSSAGALHLRAALKSGTGVGALSAGDNLLVVQNNTSTSVIFKANGDIMTDTDQTAGLSGTYDEHEDALACKDLSYGIVGCWDKTLKYNQNKLNDMGIMEGSFISHHKTLGLQLGAISELYQVVNYLCDKLNISYNDIVNIVRKPIKSTF